MATYDVIVIGVGGMGSAALYHLARRGLNVLGIEQFEPGHDRGSSHGQTRMIRKAYFEHPDYIPLVHRAFQHWAQLETATGLTLFHRTGLLLAGDPQGPIIPAVKQAAIQHHFPLEAPSRDEASNRFPMFRFTSGMEMLFEVDAGYLRVEECVLAQADQALVSGAHISRRETVKSWSGDAGNMKVHTDRSIYSARHMIICAGAWSARLLAELRLPLQIRRKVMFWFPTDDDRFTAARGCPTFGFEIGKRFYYGLPSLDGRTVKVSEHTGGSGISSPEELNRDLVPGEQADVVDFISEYLPTLTPTVHAHSVCMYTMTPDDHFVIDRHPDHPNVVYAAGFSGHGFKFAPVVGEVLADLVTTGRTSEPVGFLAASRLTDI